MLDHDYVTKPEFNKNFFMDWRKVQTIFGINQYGISDVKTSLCCNTLTPFLPYAPVYYFAVKRSCKEILQKLVSR